MTYASNIQVASQLLQEAGDEYSREFLLGAQAQLEQMRTVPPADSDSPRGKAAP